VVFTVPHELNVLALENPRVFYDLLFTASAQRTARLIKPLCGIYRNAPKQ